MSDPQSRCVVITGASAGVGRAIAHRFASEGWRVGLLARDTNALADVAREVEARGGHAFVAAIDVANSAQVVAAADAITEAFGNIDVWINNAMVTVFSPVWSLTPEEFARVTSVTYLGAVHGTMAALAHMRRRNRGHLIQIGSSLAYRGIPLQSAYCGAKHAIRGFTDSLRAELISESSAVSVTMVQLPAVNTPQFDWARTHMPRQPRPAGPVFEPEVIARTVFDVVQHPRREVWISAGTQRFIIGNMLLPGVVDRVLSRVAIKGQETDAPVERGRRDNLEAPVAGLHRTRGRFSAEARSAAISMPEAVARLAPVLLAGLALFALGRLSATRRGNGELRYLTKR